MTVERTLERVEADRAVGELRRARDRLHGLRVTYPDRLDLRVRLAEVYRQLGDPIQAGRWGYLRRPASAMEEVEREAFERWARIGWRGRPAFRPWERIEELLRLPAEITDPEALAIANELLDARSAERGRGCVPAVALLTLLVLLLLLLTYLR